MDRRCVCGVPLTGSHGNKKWCDVCRPLETQRLRRAYNERNHELQRSRAAQWYLDNKERFQETNAAWHEANRDKSNAAIRRWKQKNPNKVREADQRRRARQLQAFVENVDPCVLWSRDRGTCGICGQPAERGDFHIDHVMPLSRGGEHSYANTQVAHPKCNLRKSASLPQEAV